MDESRKNGVVDRLHAREEARIANFQRRREERESRKDPTEDVSLFWRDANDLKQRVQRLLKLAMESKSAKSEADEAISKAKVILADIKRRVGDASVFLPVHDTSQAQKVVAELEDSINAASLHRQPRKRFAFSKTPKTKKAPVEEAKKVEEEATKPALAEPPRERTFKGWLPRRPGSQRRADRKDDIVRVLPGQWAGAGGGRWDIALSAMQGCTVLILEITGAAHIEGLKDCHVVLGPVAGSILVDNCHNCVFCVPCRQARLHDSSNCSFFLHCRSGPIIEGCSEARFGDYCLAYPEFKSQLKVASEYLSLFNPGTQTAGLHGAPSRFRDVKDFHWLREQHSPNWSVLPGAEWAEIALPKVDSTLTAAAEPVPDEPSSDEEI